jgi:hypothetical protein
MPIVNLCKATADGAVGYHYTAGYYAYVDGQYITCPGPNAYWTRLSHVGLCISEREHNMYDDSDFYMTVWNQEKGEPEEIMFGTTRGWTYPCMASSVDATPEVRAAYDAWNKARIRRIEVTQKWQQRCEIREVASMLSCSAASIKRLRAATGIYKWPTIVDLLLNKRIRSKFKLSLRSQIMNWLAENDPQYASPLSRKQWDYIEEGERSYVGVYPVDMSKYR